MRKLIDPEYMAFPLRIGKQGAATSRRQNHVREQIEQVLFTNPGERLYRKHFGAGLRLRVFEPNSTRLREGTRQQLVSSLIEALQGEVDPKSLSVDVNSDNERLNISVTYQLATIGQWETHELSVEGDGHG